MDMNSVSRDEFDGRKKLCDERFKRDQERIENNEENVRTTAELLARVTGIVDTLLQKTEDQEKRLRDIEMRPSKKMDSIWSFIVGGIVTAVLGFLAGKLL